MTSETLYPAFNPEKYQRGDTALRPAFDVGRPSRDLPEKLLMEQRKAAAREPWEARLRQLRRAAKASHAALGRLYEEQRTLRNERGELMAYIESVTEGRFGDPVTEVKPTDSPPLARARLQLADVERLIQNVEVAIAEAQAEWNPQIALVTACEQWLSANGDRIAAGRLCEYGN